ncbi:hypothetical protein [Shewanella dokdonensis]|uniref:Uncharacterized protein n=1 Tax=Shewanella dokdonensis TaxID=712036 RepID=A0ABX8DGB5_9GAMM|nr:hypothetical protein [Shewanella dokdonensis]MCL1075987.1 hypothetical protein [Shewanella dokdonensis]QVK23256.1 hypothetical protein KHX94_19890 [Shewanella dokdonensis]
MDDNLKAGLDIFELSIKRLVVPVTMLIAAALLSNGLSKPGSNYLLIYFYMIFLGGFAIGYGVFSGLEAMKAIDKLSITKVKRGLLGISFMLIYVVLFLTSIKLGFDKLGTL